MLKFIKHHLDTIAGIDIYPVISFVIFFTFFVLLAIYVVWERKEYFDQMGHLPLEGNSTEPQ
jgi:cytochrome c oxidase cbb3-type subunit 4